MITSAKLLILGNRRQRIFMHVFNIFATLGKRNLKRQTKQINNYSKGVGKRRIVTQMGNRLLASDMETNGE
jgi:hypothetical protein